MARFRYSMQSILNIKLKMETQAKQEFSAAKAVLSEEEERLQELRDRKAAYERESVSLLEGMEEEDRCLDLQAIKDSRMAILSMEQRIEGQKLKVSAAEKKLEQARVKLTEVMVERKTHETLRDKAFEQFLADEKRQEGKEVDELTSYTYGQRTGES
ncbi:MAG: flagellar export protein FliJ [Acetatifactor sp.]